MLSSPISVVIGATTHSLSLINIDNFASTYLKKGAGYEVRANIRHTQESVKNGLTPIERHNVEVIYTTFDEDTGLATSTSAYTVIRVPRGTDGALAADVSEGLNAFVDANAAAIIAWQS